MAREIPRGLVTPPTWKEIAPKLKLAAVDFDIDKAVKVFEDIWGVSIANPNKIQLLPTERIHALPLSKEYPELPEEEKEILRRHNIMFNEVAKDDDIVLIYSLSPDFGIVGAEPFVKAAEYIDPYDKGTSGEFVFKAYLLAVDKSKIPFDELILSVAHEIERFSFYSPTGAWGYSPYPGGADIKMLDKYELKDIWLRHSGWHPMECNCGQHSSLRKEAAYYRMVNKGEDSPHDCHSMKYELKDQRTPLYYNRAEREWYLKRDGFVEKPIEYCPFCGEKLPKSFSHIRSSKFMVEVKRQKLILMEVVNDEEILPDRLKSDVWWRELEKTLEKVKLEVHENTYRLSFTPQAVNPLGSSFNGHFWENLLIFQNSWNAEKLELASTAELFLAYGDEDDLDYAIHVLTPYFDDSVMINFTIQEAKERNLLLVNNERLNMRSSDE